MRQKLTIVLKRAILDTMITYTVANHSNIALNKEMLPLLHPLGGFTSILQSKYKHQEQTRRLY